MLTKPDETSARRQTWQAFALLRRAARPDLRHLYWALLWLVLAAALLPAGWALLQRTGFGKEREQDGPPAGML